MPGRSAVWLVGEQAWCHMPGRSAVWLVGEQAWCHMPGRSAVQLAPVVVEYLCLMAMVLVR